MTTTTSVTPRLDALPEARRELLRVIKQIGSASASELASQLGLTREAARQQLQLLEHQQLVVCHKKNSGSAGRPALLFSLSEAGEHLFPKRYDELSLLLLDTVTEELGNRQLERLMGAITDRQVAQWQAQLAGLSLKDRLLVLKDFYFENDPYTEVIEDTDGLWLIEQNCPFLNLAMERPALCSITVSTLTRLLGVEVRREKRFQSGDGRCAFHILGDRPVATDFRFGFEDNSDS
jgi:predicted ArsR family transcriptional regulator